MIVHPAASVLADHLFRPRFRIDPPTLGETYAGACTCRGWFGADYDHPEHLAAVLAEAGLLAAGPPPETPTALAERADRRTT